MHFAKVSLFILAIFGCVVADEERNNGLRTNVVNSRSRVPPFVHFRNEIPAVFYENAAGDKVSNEATEMPGRLNSESFFNDIPQPYSFDYKTIDEEGNMHYREEQADDSGAVRGSYGYTDIDGLYRTVSYVADSTGFHVSITTNEPGVDDKESPADANFMAREPPAGIQEKYNEFRGTGVGGLKPFGSRTGAESYTINRETNPILWTNIPGNVYGSRSEGYGIHTRTNSILRTNKPGNIYLEVWHHVGGSVDNLYVPGTTIPKEDNDDYDKKKPDK